MKNGLFIAAGIAFRGEGQRHHLFFTSGLSESFSVIV
jgi:hypothetical protein